MNQLVPYCIAASENLYQELSKKLGSGYIVEHSSKISIKIKFTNNDIQYSTGMYISSGNDPNYEDISGIAYEISLYNHYGKHQIFNDKFGYPDSRNINTIDEIVLELERIRALVIKCDHNQIHNYESDSDEIA